MSVSKILLVAIAFCSSCDAQNFLQKLPSDGVTATYLYKKTISNNSGIVDRTHGTAIIRTVGTKSIDNKKFRWLEIEPHEINNAIPSNQRIILKMLVDEDSINNQTNILLGSKIVWMGEFDHIKKTTEISRIESRKNLAAWLVPPSKVKHSKIASKKIDTSIGKLSGKGIRYSYEKRLKDSKSGIDKKHGIQLTFYTNDQSPFGGIEMTEIETVGKTVTVQTLTLKSFENKAKSGLPTHWLQAK